jgi:long-chain-fatty-acid--[acyl-carrier-protein] ligase
MLLQAARWVLWFIGRVILSWRYSYTVRGREAALKHPGPFLILPNHPAYMDPPNLFVHLWPAFQLRPMLLETNFQNPILGPFGWLLRAIKVPDTSEASADVKRRAQLALSTAIDALKAGENVVLWPSGHLMRDGTEHLGSARAVSDVLAAVPHVTLVLVRTRGLWGSMFSWAYTGTKPPLIPRLFQGVALTIANGCLAGPRRKVTMTVEAFPPGSRPDETRAGVNRWLEAWYNADTPKETPTFVPHHFLFGPRTYTFPQRPTPVIPDMGRVKPATRAAIAEMLSEKLKRPLAEEENRPETRVADLGIDSLDAMEVTVHVENRFGFTASTVPTTIGDLWAIAEGMVESGPPTPPPAAWFAPPTGDMAVEVLGDTVGEALVRRCVKSPRDVALADDLSGVLTYERFFLGASVLAKRFRDIPEPHVGLLLPASAGGMVTLFALHLAGKVPVILNWTTGPGNMGHGVKLTGVKRVVTSKRFIDRVQVEVPGAEFLFLEYVRKTVGKFELLRRLVSFRLFRGSVGEAAIAKLTRDPQKPAVVLFTSGSEKAPKAVPLTHANVIGDVRAFIPRVKLDRSMVGLVFLPLFHSFGHTVTGLFPLMIGARNVFHPDPTDAGALVRKAAAYKATVIPATPTFFGFLLEKAKPGDLDSARSIVLGAEKCPDAIFEKAAKLAPNAALQEGYGITECSPVVAVNPPDAVVRGTIGLPVVGVELCVRDLETDSVLPAGKRGMLHVAGPIVFPGYLGHDGEQPFREFDGKRWYVTGDLAEIGTDGYVRFHGRLKRFLKAGGEMISLPALEEPFTVLYPPTDEGPRVAVEGVETADGRKVVLFTTEEMTLKDANAVLLKEGFRGVMRLDEVRRVEKIPVLGTGKTDYKVLRAMIG